MKQILVYAGAGVDRLSLDNLCLALTQEPSLSLFNIRKVDHHLMNQPWEEETALFVVPGGRDLPYQRALAGELNRRLRCYVEAGGRYLGICAGAYYGCSSFTFEKGSPLEICQERELHFFPGAAEGPAYGSGQFDYRSQRGARLANLNVESAERHLRCYFNGGCSFPGTHNFPMVSVIARYADLPDEPAAIVSCTVGKGKALLSGVHPEYHHERMYSPCCHLQQLLPQMAAAEAERRWLWSLMIEQLLA
jgi:biotin--protein ligase